MTVCLTDIMMTQYTKAYLTCTEPHQTNEPSVCHPSPALVFSIAFMEYQCFLQAGFFTLRRPISHIMPCAFRGLGFHSIWHARMCQNKRFRNILKDKVMLLSDQNMKQFHRTISSNIESCKIQFFV